MKKHLLLGLMAGMTALSASAFDNGEYVYTNQGRFQITNAQNLYTGNFTDFSGWTAVSATDGTKISSLFTSANDETYPTAVVSQTAALTEGMSYTYTPTDPSQPFVVSLKMKGTESSSGTPLSTVNTSYCGEIVIGSTSNGANLVKVEGIDDAGEAVVLNSGLTLPAGWSTVAFGVNADGSYSSYKITIMSLNTNIAVADVQIQSAVQVADLRQRDAVLKYAEAFAAANPEAVDDDYTENYDLVKGITDESAQEALDDAITGLNTILTDNIKPTLDDQLGQSQSHCGLWETKLAKVSTWGEWTTYPSGRTHCTPVAQEDGTTSAYPDFGHYAGYLNWGGASGGTCGISMDTELQPGKYVFVTNALGQARQAKKSTCWDVSTSLDYVYGVMYVCKADADAAYTDTLATTGNYGISPLNYTQGVLSFEITEAGTYQVGMKSYAYADNDASLLGGALILKDVEFYGKTSAEYTKAQEQYYTNVETQVTAGRTGLETAAAYVANADYKWGKADLQAMIDSCTSKIVAYEDSLKDKAAVIATMPEGYSGGTSTISKGSDGVDGMVYRAYVDATKYVLDANTKFVAKNDTLASLATAIASAKNLIAKRIYDSSTTKEDFQAEIGQAEALNAEMLAAEYSEENAAKIVAENAALATAGDLFSVSVPAELISDIIDIDFSNAATIDDANKETAETDNNTGVAATIAGKSGEMAFTNFSNATPSSTANSVYELGIAASNGERDSLGILRVGNAVATVAVAGAPVKSTDVVSVSFDYYFGLLSGKNAGYYILSEEGDTICGLVCSKYSGTDVLNTFAVNYNSNIAGVGSSAASNAAIAASSNATHFTIILDYGTGKMYCTTSGSKGTFLTDEVEFNTEKKIGTFVLYSNYNNKDRRCWFDNLKVQNYAAGEPSGISSVAASTVADDAIYNIAGQKVGKSYKGIVVKNGQKFINK